MLSWLQTCDRPDSSVSSASYMSGHPSATLNTDKSVTGNDVAQCNQESAGYQGYQQNVSIILYFSVFIQFNFRCSRV